MTGSALGFHEGLERLLALIGASCLLLKPLDPAALMAALQGAH